MAQSKKQKAKIPAEPVRMPQRSETIAGKESKGLKPIPAATRQKKSIKPKRGRG